MCETLNVPKDKVLETFEEAKTKKEKNILKKVFGKKLFQPDVMDRINGLKDIFKETGANPDDYKYDGDDVNKIIMNATGLGLLIAEAFNEGEELNWADSSQPKYFIWQKYSPSSGWALFGVDHRGTFTFCCARLGFLKREHAEKAYELFGDSVYKKINTLKK